MRTLSAGEIAALSTRPLPIAVLVEMDLTTALNLNSTSIDLDIGGTLYRGTKGLGKIEVVADSPAEVKPLKFSFSGVSSTQIALARYERVQGKAVRIKTVIFSPATYVPYTPRLRWAGRLNVFSIEETGETAVLEVTAEHAGVDLLRPVTSLYSDAEQRRLYPGDPSLQYVADQVERRIIWPSAEWGRQ